ncbi:MAG: hypothetical protein QM809_06900 [Gordonia sp. (in: high G+C Gram-positive bacteria)]|uniref:hypothetical protein n=1 Tax=Gordonia sp. (in: high G+C Gram-positive bacteria) TaxID=84139 RepID=UPI0039E48214
MAKDPDADSRQITVDELLARKGEFPRAGSPAPRRAAAEDDDSTVDPHTTASGMPEYSAPPAPPAPPTAPAVGASGMPTYAPTTRSAESRNAVTGVIPPIDDDFDPIDSATLGSASTLQPVEQDDLVGVDLPAGERPQRTGDLDDIDDSEVTGELPVVTAVPQPAASFAEDGTEETEAAQDGAATVVGPALESTDEPADAAAGSTKAAPVVDADDSGEKAGGRKGRAKAERGGKPAKSKTGKPAKTKPAKAKTKTKTEAKGDAESAKSRRGGSALLGWLGLIGEVVLGLAIGAGLFWGFTVLWKQYVYFALVLAVLVIFAIVTFAYVLRKRDLPTTLLASAVGLIVTIGPLVLLV